MGCRMTSYGTLSHTVLLAIKLLSGKRSKCCMMPVTNYLTHTKFVQVYSVMMDTLEAVGYFMRIIKQLTHYCTFYCLSLIPFENVICKMVAILSRCVNTLCGQHGQKLT